MSEPVQIPDFEKLLRKRHKTVADCARIMSGYMYKIEEAYPVTDAPVNLDSPLLIANVILNLMPFVSEWIERRRSLDSARVLEAKVRWICEQIVNPKGRTKNAIGPTAGRVAYSLRRWAEDIEIGDAELMKLGDAMTKGNPRRPASVEFDELRQLAANLKGTERRIVELICEHEGACSLADVAVDDAIQWNSPWDDAFNSARKRINKKMKKFGWEIIRHDGKVKANHLGRK